MRRYRQLEKGFTIVELLIVIGIIATLFGMSTFALLHTQHTASVSAAVDQLMADMRLQQTKAMTGTKDTTGVANSYGIHVTANSYILFQGTSDPNNSTDFTVRQDGITFSSNLPSGIIVFAQRSGQFNNYVTGPYTITISNAFGTEQKILTLNKYGVVTNKQ